MVSFLSKQSLKVQAATLVALMAGAQDVQAAGQDFSDIAANITGSIEELPGLISGMAYLVGLLMGALGIMKIKDHVENPTQTPMKDGAVRLAAGGALFGLPIVFESMLNTIGTSGTSISPPKLNKVELGVN
ncbi:MAG: hypothetical protein GW778_01750 [Alphaproteobacteria bacterium]|nr:hypothetical protein [Alphaproteobacteria bacterium]